jgi:hypothetical protein
MESETARQWHTERYTIISIIVGFIAQTLTLVYVGTSWKSDVDHRIVALEKAEDALAPAQNQIIVLQQQFIAIKDSLKRIEDKIDRKETTP